jgi:hypothetical protein
LAEEARVGHGAGQESDELERYWSGSGLPAEWQRLQCNLELLRRTK